MCALITFSSPTSEIDKSCLIVGDLQVLVRSFGYARKEYPQDAISPDMNFDVTFFSRFYLIDYLVNDLVAKASEGNTEMPLQISVSSNLLGAVRFRKDDQTYANHGEALIYSAKKIVPKYFKSYY